jgi:hypothetical protein
MAPKKVDRFGIEDDIIGNFARKFRRSIDELNRNTDLKQYISSMKGTIEPQWPPVSVWNWNR